jgi:hypothetical protein
MQEVFRDCDADKPQIRCEPEYSGIVGDTNFDVVCTGRSHPVPHRIVWSWTRTDSDGVLSGNNSGSPIIKMDERVEIFNGNINKPDLQPVSLRNTLIKCKN